MQLLNGLSFPVPREVSSILSTSKAREELVVPEIPMEEGHELREGQEEMEEGSPRVVRLVGELRLYIHMVRTLASQCYNTTLIATFAKCLSSLI